MRDQQHPDSDRSLANTCENITVAASVVLLVVGSYSGNAFNVRFGGSRGVDWGLLGIWLGAATICLTVGLCLTAICRQVADKDE